MAGDRQEAPPGFEPRMADLQSAAGSAQPVAMETTCENKARRPDRALTKTDATDPDLQRVAAAWPELPDAIRRAILALVESAPTKEGRL